MSSKSQYAFGYSSASKLDAASLDHNSPRERAKFYHAILESLYLKIDLTRFSQPIPDNYQRLRAAAAFDQK